MTNPDGTPFNGVVLITWNGYSAPGGTPVSELSASARIYNGALSVLLVPTTTAVAGTYYQVVYNSSDGTVTWSETWQVPPSTTALTLAQVRQTTTEGSTNTGSSGGTTTGQYATLPIAIGNVTGLSADLSSLNTSIAALTTQSTANGTAIGTLNTEVAAINSTLAGMTSVSAGASFVDAALPGGTINGTNAAFALAAAPSPATSLAIYRNGLLQSAGVDFTLSGSSVTFLSASIPQTGDIVQAYYRVAGTGPAATFVDAEVPTGTIDGTNLAFTLANAPNPATSLKLYKNGLLMSQNGDYTLSGASITFVSAAKPVSPDTLQAAYRH